MIEVVNLAILVLLFWVAKKSFNIFSKTEYDWLRNEDYNAMIIQNKTTDNVL